MDHATPPPVASWRGQETLGTLTRHLLSMPVVYGLLLPIALLDAAVSLYQAVCFRLWRIPTVHRSSHLILDRHKLAYLNAWQKLNCLYCGYANGVLAYAQEIASRTEQYWCPIKHATDPAWRHARYADFIDYADAKGFVTRMPELRAAVQATGRANALQDRVGVITRELEPCPDQE